MYSQNLGRPAVGQRQNHNVAVQGLRDALFEANCEVKSLKKRNTALNEQVGLLEHRQMEVSQLQEKLKQTENLLRSATKKRWDRTKAHMDTLYLLTCKKKELKESNQQIAYDALEVSLREELAQKEESWRKKEEEMEREKERFCHTVLTPEEEWKQKMSQAEENMELLRCNVTQLQLSHSTKEQEPLEKAETQQEEEEKKEEEREKMETNKRKNEKEVKTREDKEMKMEKKREGKEEEVQEKEDQAIA